MALAQAAARRDPRKRALLQSALGDPDTTIRWWGATGLAMLGTRNAAQYLIQQLDGSYDPHKPIFDLERVLRNPPR